ncbi:MAG: hypothetical protein J1E80_02750 [Desulfovibrionaceae bacterium]|nr:hypothetical protein [Desulfovibrionaceae bacterium]
MSGSQHPSHVNSSQIHKKEKDMDKIDSDFYDKTITYMKYIAEKFVKELYDKTEKTNMVIMSPNFYLRKFDDSSCHKNNIYVSLPASVIFGSGISSKIESKCEKYIINQQIYLAQAYIELYKKDNESISTIDDIHRVFKDLEFAKFKIWGHGVLDGLPKYMPHYSCKKMETPRSFYMSHSHYSKGISDAELFEQIKSSKKMDRAETVLLNIEFSYAYEYDQEEENLGHFKVSIMYKRFNISEELTDSVFDANHIDEEELLNSIRSHHNVYCSRAKQARKQARERARAERAQSSSGDTEPLSTKDIILMIIFLLVIIIGIVNFLFDSGIIGFISSILNFISGIFSFILNIIKFIFKFIASIFNIIFFFL